MVKFIVTMTSSNASIPSVTYCLHTKVIFIWISTYSWIKATPCVNSSNINCSRSNLIWTYICFEIQIIFVLNIKDHYSRQSNFSYISPFLMNVCFLYNKNYFMSCSSPAVIWWPLTGFLQSSFPEHPHASINMEQVW